MSPHIPPGPVAVLQTVTFALGTEEAAVLLPGWEVPDGKGESLSLSQEAGRGNLRPETLGSEREVMEHFSGVNAAQCAVSRWMGFLFGLSSPHCLFSPPRCWNTPDISIGLPRTGICEGTERPPRIVSLPSLQ